MNASGRAPLNGLIVFARSGNTGDAIQSLAALAFLPSVDILLDRESLDRVASEEPRPIRAIANGWFAHNPDRWPPSSNLSLLATSMHLSPRTISAFYSGASASYTRRLGSVGARDQTTLRSIQAAGGEAHFTGCLTLTLPRPRLLRAGHIALCDVGEEVEAWVRATTPSPVVVTSHAEAEEQPLAVKLQSARARLAVYASARCVITTRLHAALPCVAFGTPVFLLTDVEDGYRFDGLADLMPHGSARDLFEGTVAFDLETPPEPLTKHKILVRELRASVATFLAADQLEGR